MAIINTIIHIIPITPAVTVLVMEFSPKEAATVLEDTSSNLVGRDPELINSTSVFTSFSSKFP